MTALSFGWRGFALWPVLGLLNGPALAQTFDATPAWPLCGRITENAPAGWNTTQGCPADRWGKSAHTDLPLSSTFGPRQKASENFRYDYHRGLDIPTPINTPVFAVAAGVVQKAGSDPGYEDLLVQLRHYRPGSSSCTSVGCYHTNYLHLASWVVSVGQSVEKGQLIGYSGPVGGGFTHLHFEVRDALASDPFSAWQLDAIHPLRMLAYADLGGTGTQLSVDSVTVGGATAGGTQVQVQATVSVPADQADLQKVQLRVYQKQGKKLTLISQPGDTVNSQGYYVNPPWFDVNTGNRQYSHKNSTSIPWSSFGVGGNRECPYATAHGPSYDANLHLDKQDAADTRVGLFNGVRIAPAAFNSNSSRHSMVLSFNELLAGANPAAICVKLEATDVRGAVTSVSHNCQ